MNMILNNQHWIDFFQGYVLRVELESAGVRSPYGVRHLELLGCV